MGSRLPDIYEQREMLRRGDEISQAAEQAAAREAERLRLRDQFAAAALAGMLEQDDVMSEMGQTEYKKRLCRMAYGWADAMLAARDRTTGSGERHE